jgi:hypothetical protein
MNARIRISGAALACALFAGSAATAFEWPVATVKPSSFFGQRAAGAIGRGITLDNADTIRASGHGSLLVTIERNRNMSGFPGTLGNAAILTHDDGLLTVYGNLDALDRVDGRTQIDSGTILGNAGTSGWGKAGSCFFQVIDTERKTVLNPMLVLPGLKDKRGPVIKDVIVAAGNNTVSALGSVKMLKQGKYRLYANVTDMVDDVAAEVAPFSINILVNGKEYGSIPFEVLQEEKGRLYLGSPAYTWPVMYGDETRMFLAEIPLNRGRADISIIAKDAAGNERSVLFGVQVE